MLANTASESTGPSSCFLFLTALFSRLPCFVLFCWLVSSVQIWDLSSLIFFRSSGKSCVQALCVGVAPKQTKGSSDWHPHPQKRMPPIVSQFSFSFQIIAGKSLTFWYIQPNKVKTSLGWWRQIFHMKAYYKNKSFKIIQARYKKKFNFNTFPKMSKIIWSAIMSYSSIAWKQ